jgi:arginine N-succinyltransferase
MTLVMAGTQDGHQSRTKDGRQSVGTASVRTVREDDLDALFGLSALTGGGMTNLPHDRDALAEKVAWSCRSIAVPVEQPGDEFYMLVLEDSESGQIIGTASLLGRLGARWPFYSYRLVRITHSSRELDRSVSTPMLQLTNDFDGASEVGGLFLHPAARASGMGRLLARSRYLFIAQHRARFGQTIVAELRGHVVDGVSPFWEGVGRHFFGSDFLDADHHNALHGNQFIIDLMPRHPLYVPLLPADARQAIGRAHENSEPARRLLEKDGFRDDGYVDIFDAGPTISASTDQVIAIRDSQLNEYRLVENGLGDAATQLLALGSGSSFCAWAAAGAVNDGVLTLAPDHPVHAALLNKGSDQLVRHVAF